MVMAFDATFLFLLLIILDAILIMYGKLKLDEEAKDCPFTFY